MYDMMDDSSTNSGESSVNSDIQSSESATPSIATAESSSAEYEDNSEGSLNKSAKTCPSDVDIRRLLDLQSFFDCDEVLKLLELLRIIPDRHDAQLSRWHILDWLQQMCDDGNIVDRAMLVEHFSSVFPHSNCQQAFDEIDFHEDGRLQLDTITPILQDSALLLLHCPFTPSMINLFVNDAELSDCQSRKIMRIVQKVVIDPYKFLPNQLYLWNNFASIRRKTLQQICNEASEQSEGETLSDKMMKVLNPTKPHCVCPVVPDRTFVEVAHSKVIVSSNPSSMANMLKDDKSTFWQSNGPKGSHWVRLFIRDDVELDKLSIWVTDKQLSFMPKTINVMAGPSMSELELIRRINVMRTDGNRISIFEDTDSSKQYKVIELRIKECHEDGMDVRINHVYATGYKNKEDLSLRLQDSYFIWLLQIVTSNFKNSEKSNPDLIREIIQHSREILEFFPPLSLTKLLADSTPLVNKHLLRQISDFLPSLSCCSQEFQLDILHLRIYLALACGEMSLLLQLLISALKEHFSADFSVVTVKMNLPKSLKTIKYSLFDSNPVTLIQQSIAVEEDLEKKQGYLNVFYCSEHPVCLTGINIKAVKSGKHICKCYFYILNESLASFDEELKKQFVALDALDAESVPKNVFYWQKCSFAEDSEDGELSILLPSVPTTFVVVMRFTSDLATEAPGIPEVNFLGWIDQKKKIKKMEIPKEPSCSTFFLEVTHFLIEVLSFEENYFDLQSIKMSMLLEILEVSSPHTDLFLQSLRLIYFLFPRILPEFKYHSELLPSNENTDGDISDSQKVFRHLHIAHKQFSKSSIQRKIIEEILMLGIDVFFPSAQKRKHLLQQIIASKSPDVLLLEALCGSFGNITLSQFVEQFSCDFSLIEDIIESIFNCTKLQFSTCEGDAPPMQMPLLQLAATLQTQIFTWFKKSKDKHLSGKFLANYIKLHLERVEECIMGIVIQEQQNYNLISYLFPRMLILLETVTHDLVDELMLWLINHLHRVILSLSVFDMESIVQSDEEELLLQMWSPSIEDFHLQGSSFKKFFSAPGATRFELEFMRNTNLNAVDIIASSGQRRHLRWPIGSGKWPFKVFIESPNCLCLIFSVSGYKSNKKNVKVSAFGFPYPKESNLTDLRMEIARLMGLLVSSILKPMQVDAVDDEKLKSTPMWTTLFQGGLQISTGDESLSAALMQFNCGENPKLEQMWKCLSPSRIFVGGAERIGNCIRYLFSALCWHSAEIRPVLQQFIDLSASLDEVRREDVPDAVHDACTVAQAMRGQLVELDQRHRSGRSSESLDKWIDKCMFLLSLSPSPSFTKKVEAEKKRSTLHSATSSIIIKWRKIVDENYCFQQVLQFLRDAEWDVAQIKEIMRGRFLRAQSLTTLYSSLSKIFYDILTAPSEVYLIFIQQLLESRRGLSDEMFAALTGCGLVQQEAVIHAYQNLLCCLMEKLYSQQHAFLETRLQQASHAYLLNLLSVNWSKCHYKFLINLDVPGYLFALTKLDCSRKLTVSTDELSDPMPAYHQNCEWMEESSGDLLKWLGEKEKQKEFGCHSFVARFNSLLEDVILLCDVCNNSLPTPQIRCLECVDFDLCFKCFEGGFTIRHSEHLSSHQLLRFSQQCSNCKVFIFDYCVGCSTCNDLFYCFGCAMTHLSKLKHSHKLTVYPNKGFFAEEPSLSPGMIILKLLATRLFEYLCLESTINLSSSGEPGCVDQLQSICVQFIEQRICEAEVTSSEKSHLITLLGMIVSESVKDASLYYSQEFLVCLLQMALHAEAGSVHITHSLEALSLILKLIKASLLLPPVMTNVLSTFFDCSEEMCIPFFYRLYYSFLLKRSRAADAIIVQEILVVMSTSSQWKKLWNQFISSVFIKMFAKQDQVLDQVEASCYMREEIFVSRKAFLELEDSCQEIRDALSNNSQLAWVYVDFQDVISLYSDVKMNLQVVNAELYVLLNLLSEELLLRRGSLVVGPQQSKSVVLQCFVEQYAVMRQGNWRVEKVARNWLKKQESPVCSLNEAHLEILSKLATQLLQLDGRFCMFLVYHIVNILKRHSKELMYVDSPLKLTERLIPVAALAINADIAVPPQFPCSVISRCSAVQEPQNRCEELFSAYSSNPIDPKQCLADQRGKLIPETEVGDDVQLDLTKHLHDVEVTVVDLKDPTFHLCDHEIVKRGSSNQIPELQDQSNLAATVLSCRELLAELLPLHLSAIMKLSISQAVNVLIALHGTENYLTVLQQFVRGCDDISELSAYACGLLAWSHHQPRTSQINPDSVEKVWLPGAKHMHVYLSKTTFLKVDISAFSLFKSKESQHKTPICIKGDTVYLRYHSDINEEENIKVYGDFQYLFDIGFSIMKEVCQGNDIHHAFIFETLIALACGLAGLNRQTVLNLLIKLLHCSSADLELSLLKPLWRYYCDCKENTSMSGQLTQLFLLAEQRAKKWGKQVEYTAMLKSSQEIRESIVLSMVRIALLSLAIDYSNSSIDYIRKII